ncbi:MAG TPA: hypothetical protein VGN82_19080 [Bosea sp. (in: a-proteobacteria)]|jgi:uncharacterized membrane protein|uniref:DUF1254 domain-containing protein n=1 Tax=Bosea sp. (in: a-proteobacteria) TaxID=1871050 RepID=UPI002E0EAA39|nr:hypothetical protein [Bosea sp. (in: a-proteobacteria)]
MSTTEQEIGDAVAAGPRPLPRGARFAAALRRLLLATLAGLVLAGIVHIVTVLLVPVLSDSDAAHAYRVLGTSGKAELITSADRSLPLPREADAATVTAICSYDLTGGPMRVVARAGTLPLGLTLHRRGGGVLYAITDRAAIRGVVEFVVMTEEQRDERLARDEEGEAARELRVVSDTDQGLIVARVLVRHPSDRADAEALASGVACGMAD